ncbi:hypothetical protein HHK36_020735 [Tetracentron sinense]|uniref:DNA polymerase n=1 Tax=Tetracentron sinense TaxID=13715 RepID=A0A834YVM2_TETSI|nr:hypothetical protein HHK36_020735 [Tetracentron sinense]
MAESQSDSNFFSVRIVSIDYYMAPPIADMDICYSSFQGGKVNEVPVIRIYGSTPAGQKTCLHVHRALPYLYVPCSDISLQTNQEGDAYTLVIARAIEKALTLKGSYGFKRQHVHGCSLIRARKFYGYHSSEELFVKIYLYQRYYPHEIARAANLLLGGADLDKSFQPHESHIPFLLQFLVDYNLYGMGHLHLSKVKFRHPIPDIFIPRAAHYNDRHREGIENSTFVSANCQADSSADACLGSPVWITSTIPSGWVWPFSIEVDTSLDQDIHFIKRQSICELEGDGTVNEILNQQFKMYSSLSQTRSEVKMVQSLIPIWEEEYERTGIHETMISPDPSKPPPENVLRTLSHGHEFENTLMDLCREAETCSQVTPREDAEKFMQSIKSLADLGDLVELGKLVNFNNFDAESLKHSKERKKNGSMLSRGSICKEDDDAIFAEERDGYPELLPVDNEMLTPEMTDMTDPKIADKEALGLLRWLASSQAAEDINTDDELVHETILSPLLPTTTIDKVLEKANMDYESESQQECQDILDSVEDLSELEGSKERASRSTDLNHVPHTSSDKMIPQVDGSCDDEYTTPCAGNSFETEMKCEFEKSSPNQVPQDTGVDRIIERKRNKLVWGSLPFSMQQKVNEDVQSTSFNLTDKYGNDTKYSACTGSSDGNEVDKCNDASVTNTDTHICGLKDGNTLTECSLRDLMRRKRCYRVEPSEYGTCRVKKVHSRKELKEETFLCPKRLDFRTLQSDRQAIMSQEPLTIKSLFTDQQAELHERSSCATTCILESVDKGLQRKNTLSSSCLTTSTVEHANSSKDGYVSKIGEEGSTTLQLAPEICSENLENTNASTGEIVLQIENYGGEQDRQTGLSVPDSSVSRVFNTKGRTVEYIEMTFCKKPPTVEWADGTSENASLGRDADEFLPFFVDNCQEEKEVKYNFYKDDGFNSHREAVMGVPTHYQNDGSFLYLLTPIFSPPSVGCVNKWLLHDDTGILEENIHAASMEHSSPKHRNNLLPVNVNNTSWNCGEASSKHQEFHAVSSSDTISSQENHRDFKREANLCRTEVTTEPQNEVTNVKVKECAESWQDISQISGPDARSKLTPLSQMGFRDPASVGSGQQLTLLSIEIQAESRGDLRPDPRFDAVNLIALAILEDSNHILEVYVLLRSDAGESRHRNLDAISGCKVLVNSEEKHLFNHFVKIVCSFDPDILMGWELQGGSLGFLAERAAHLGIGLLNKISRTPASETKMSARDLTNPEQEMPDNLPPEAIFADSVLLEDSVIEDEWGRTHASGVHVGGRIVLNIWRLMRGEIKLNMYTIEAVAEAVLRRKIPFIPCRTLTQWFSSGPGRARFRCIEYVIERAKLNLEIVNQLDMINRTSELARVFGIDFFSVLSRGSQYRVESMLLRLAHTQNYLAISPGNQQVALQPAMECLPLVMEPESGFYADPVVVLDFQSLYPSMIIAYNLCFCTCLGKVVPSKANTLGVSSYSPDPQLLRDLKHQLLLTPNGVMYVPSKVRRGVLPRLLEEILSTRIMVKQAMKKLAPSQQVLDRIFNSRQLALKLISNVTYGYTAAGFSGRMPCAELADSIVQCGRRTLESAISFVNAHDKWNAKVIYGDTDSMFVLLKGRTVKESLKIGQEIASAITAMNPDPVKLKMEKVYYPCFLLTKKRYVGYSYESPDQTEPAFDAKGIETVRRDTCGAVAKTLEQSLRQFFEHQDISRVKVYLQRQWTRILRGRMSLQDFVFAKEVRLGTYSIRASSLPPAAIVAAKAMKADPRAEPRYAERIPYVVIHGEPGARLVDMVVDPLDLLAIDSPFRLNDLYYINKQIIPALQRVFGLVGANLNHWFLEMPRPVRETVAKRHSYAPNSHRTRIEYYYLSKHCILCGELVQTQSHLCDKCSKKGPAIATTVIGRTSKLERDIQHLAAICRHCGGGDWIVESGVKCTSLACTVFYERRKVQKELLALSAVAMETGFYPSCMVEWF